MSMKDSFETFPTGAPYSRDKLTFAHSYIDKILAWKKRMVTQLQKLKHENGDPLLQTYTVEMLLEEILGDKKK